MLLIFQGVRNLEQKNFAHIKDIVLQKGLGEKKMKLNIPRPWGKIEQAKGDTDGGVGGMFWYRVAKECFCGKETLEG